MGIDESADLADNSAGIVSLPHAVPLLLTPNFDIELVEDDTTVVVMVSGEVDLSTAPRLAEELRRAAAGGLDLSVDLERVEFMDCSGLHVLASFAEEADSGAFSVTPGPRQVQRLFELAGMADVVPVVAPRPLLLVRQSLGGKCDALLRPPRAQTWTRRARSAS